MTARLAANPSRMGTLARRFGASRQGVSAIEFALVLPIMLVMYVGLSEYAHAIDNWRKLTLLARTVSDLTSQGDKQNPIGGAMMNDILGASRSVMRPFNGSDARIVVSAMAVDPQILGVRPRVCSSYATSNATVRPVDTASDLTAPDGLQLTGMRYVLTEASMTYTPMLGSTLLKLLRGPDNPIVLKASIAWPVRGGQAYPGSLNNEIVLPGGSPCKILNS